MERPELTLTLDDHKKAFTEISFLVEMLVKTIEDVVGRSSASLGTQAGRHMAKKIPVYLAEPTPDAVLGALARTMHDGFELTYTADNAGADLNVGRCALREVCRQRDLQLGGELCKMFHSYLGGMTAELLGGRPVRAQEATVGETCSFHLDIK